MQIDIFDTIAPEGGLVRVRVLPNIPTGFRDTLYTVAEARLLGEQFYTLSEDWDRDALRREWARQTALRYWRAAEMAELQQEVIDDDAECE